MDVKGFEVINERREYDRRRSAFDISEDNHGISSWMIKKNEEKGNYQSSILSLSQKQSEVFEYLSLQPLYVTGNNGGYLLLPQYRD